MKEVFEHESWIDIGSGEGYEIHVEVTRVEEGTVLDALDWCLGSSFFCGNYLLRQKIALESVQWNEWGETFFRMNSKMALDIIDVLLTCKRKESAAARLTSSLLKQVQIDTREK